MIKPTIHLNGTSARSLIEEWEKAYDALNAAYKSMKECAPNGRDYYPQGPNSLDTAIGEHLRRLSQVDSVINEYELLIEHASEFLK